MGEEKKIKLKDKNGNSIISFEESNGNLPLNPNENYEISSEMRKNKLKKNNPLTDNIGPGSQGFTGVAMLAGVVAVAGAIIAYFALRF